MLQWLNKLRDRVLLQDSTHHHDSLLPRSKIHSNLQNNLNIKSSQKPNYSPQINTKELQTLIDLCSHHQQRAKPRVKLRDRAPRLLKSQSYLIDLANQVLNAYGDKVSLKLECDSNLRKNEQIKGRPMSDHGTIKDKGV